MGTNTTNKQGLWNLPGYPTSDWIASLRNVSARYSSNPLVVGMDIRNEIHDQALRRKHSDPFHRRRARPAFPTHARP